MGDLGSIPGLGRFPGEGKGYPLQYSSLENSMDCIVHGVAKSRTGLTFTNMNSPVSIKEIEFVPKIFLTKKAPGIKGFSDAPDIKG